MSDDELNLDTLGDRKTALFLIMSDTDTTFNFVIAMEKLKKHIHDDSNGLDYVLVGDYYIPDLQLPEESRPIGRWGRMHREYLQEYCPDRYNELLLSGKLWTYLADLDEQAQNRLDCTIAQIKETEGVTEELKAKDQLAWVGHMNSIRHRAEEIIRSEMIYC